jgi:hypothetical protein
MYYRSKEQVADKVHKWALGFFVFWDFLRICVELDTASANSGRKLQVSVPPKLSRKTTSSRIGAPYACFCARNIQPSAQALSSVDGMCGSPL